jgi:hypothetical protein
MPLSLALSFLIFCIAFSTSSVPEYWCIKVSPRDFSGLSFTHRQSKIYPKNKCWTQFACEYSSFALCFSRTDDANARYHLKVKIHTSSGCSPAALHLQEIETCFLSKLSTIGETLTVLRLDGLEIFASIFRSLVTAARTWLKLVSADAMVLQMMVSLHLLSIAAT